MGVKGVNHVKQRCVKYLFTVLRTAVRYLENNKLSGRVIVAIFRYKHRSADLAMVLLEFIGNYFRPKETDRDPALGPNCQYCCRTLWDG